MLCKGPLSLHIVVPIYLARRILYEENELDLDQRVRALRLLVATVTQITNKLKHIIMTPEEILKNEKIYFGQDTIGGIDCSIGYIKKFKWSWFATQLNTFVIIGKTNDKIDKQVIEDFSKNCFKYSLKNHKGWPRGLQAGVGSIAILLGNSIDNEAKLFCEKLSKKHWSAFEIPVLYNSDEKKPIRYIKNPIWGRIYFPFFTKTIDSITSQLG